MRIDMRAHAVRGLDAPVAGRARSFGRTRACVHQKKKGSDDS